MPKVRTPSATGGAVKEQWWREASERVSHYRRKYRRASKEKAKAEALVREQQRMLDEAQAKHADFVTQMKKLEGQLLEARRRRLPLHDVDSSTTISFLPKYVVSYERKTEFAKLNSIARQSGLDVVTPVATEVVLVVEGETLVLDEGKREVLTRDEAKLTCSDPRCLGDCGLPATQLQTTCAFCHDAIYFKRGPTAECQNGQWYHVRGDAWECRTTNRLFRAHALPTTKGFCPTCGRPLHAYEDAAALLHVLNNSALCPV